ncbi:vWA domain-containing protein [Paraliomyxa miuraensis]|uniref:vWA domain-containing protein n=1 Tax=Paraliomyxa miuraensis TaxID=376150 RepID=UPI0022564091|nr:vWA domain-containing protein [Paraliomyxa miuraensis]MCX4240342.1 VWA domain-containing protein [Paraliomyxa miuraensis]
MHHASRLPILALALCPLVLGCGEPLDPMGAEDSTTTGIPPATTMPTTTTTTTTGEPETTTSGPPPMMTSTGEGDSTTADDDGVDPPKFDYGGLPDFMPIEEECGKVDFLFVIDNSGSMGDEQANLVANFPAFINGIQATLENVETIQVGVVTTDTYTYNIAGCQQLSSLVVQTGGSNSSNQACGPYAEGYNFMTDMDDLVVEFSCAAQIGTSGSASERPMQAAVEAVTRVQGGVGQCNEGFIRDDALLVIVIITDESDINSVGTSMTWYDDIVAAKLDIPENIVVVSLINVPGSACNTFDPANGIADFTTMFGDNGFMAEICLPDYGPIFDEAVGIIDVACDNYIPPG